jgi:hypothetical protein
MPEFNLRFGFWLEGPLNVSRLKKSLGRVMQRHGSLRTQFVPGHGGSRAVVRPAADIGLPFVLHDLSAGMPTEDPRVRALLARKAELLAEQEALTPFDARRAPLLRVCLFRIGADENLLLLVVHHVIVDGWSVEVLVEELAEHYSAASSDPQALPSEPPLQFTDFVYWQRHWSTTAGAKQQLEYWKERLQGASPIFPVPVDRRSGLSNGRRAEQPIELSRQLAASLTALSRTRSVSLFATLLAGFKALLLARCERQDICVAVSGANRTHLGTERVIGPLVNTLLIRTPLSAEISFGRALDLVSTGVVDAFARQDLPFDMLASRLAEEDNLNLAPLHQVVFDVQSGFQRPFELRKLAVRPIGNFHREQPLLPVDISWIKVTLRENSSGIVGTCSYRSDVLEAKTVRRWMADYAAILTGAAANPEAALGQLVR